MSFEVEFGLPGAKPYEYVHIKVTGETLADLLENLNQLDGPTVECIQLSQREWADIIVHGGKYQPKPQPTQTAVFTEKPMTSKQKEDLVVSELGAKVVDVQQKPWERPAPGTVNVNLL